MRHAPHVLLAAAILVLGSVTLPTEAAASHPAPFPHKHTSPAPRKVAPRATPRRVVKKPIQRQRTIHRVHSDVYGGVNIGGSFLAGGTLSQLSTIDPSGIMLEALSGWRANPWVAMEITGLVGLHADEDPLTPDLAVIAAGCLNAKMFLNPSWQRFEPYVLLGVGIYGAAREDQDTTAFGLGVQGGVGVDVHLNPAVSVSADATYRGALWEDDTLQNFFQSFVTGTVGLKLWL